MTMPYKLILFGLDGTPTCFVRLSTRDLLEKYLRGRETII